MKPLAVWWQHHLVGEVSLTRTERMEFAYAAEWLDSPSAFPISLSLPLRPESYGEPAHSFFANLLPEADVRARVCQRLKVTPGNDYELLRLIGGECAGALTLGDSAPSAGFSAADYRPITGEQLRVWSVASTSDVFSSTVGRDGVRLSLAGAQDKLPVRISGREVTLPLGQAPSTHLLKFASASFKYLPENEYLLGKLARALSLPVPQAELWRPAGGGTILVVERYDRREDERGVQRLHQEDLCQALGRSPLRKYQKEGGPRHGDLAEIIRIHGSLPPNDLRLLARWAIFNWLVGNCDAHGKNVSILLSPGGGTRLAPFYDLVCTRVYKPLDRNLAMSFGEQFDPGQVIRRDLEAYAREIQVGSGLVMRIVDGMLTEISRKLDEVIGEFRGQHGDSPILEMIRVQVARHLRRAAITLR